MKFPPCRVTAAKHNLYLCARPDFSQTTGNTQRLSREGRYLHILPLESHSETHQYLLQVLPPREPELFQRGRGEVNHFN